MNKNKIVVWYNYGLLLLQGKQLGKFDNIEEARKCIQADKHYNEILFDDMGNATINNKNRYESYIVYNTKYCERLCIR
jgi:hypothetical protein